MPPGFFLGHGPGAIAAPPLVFGDYLLVAVNDTAADSSLRVLGIQSGVSASAPPFRLVQTIPLKGHVDVAPSLSGEKVLVATDAGSHVFELAPAGAEEPLREAAGGKLQGGVRRTAAMPGVMVSSSAATTDLPIGKPAWPCPLSPSRSQFDAVATARSRSQPRPAASSSWTAAPWPRRPSPTSRRCRRRIARAGHRRGPMRRHARADLRRRLRLGGGHGPAAPRSVADVALAGAAELSARRVWRRTAGASQVGQVFFLDPFSGKIRSEPFQPRLQPGRLPAWTEPVAVGDKEVVISDGRTKLYRLRVADQPAAAPGGGR